MNTTQIIPVIDEHRLTEGQKRYWLSASVQTRAAARGCSLIDPWRRKLKVLRTNPEWIGKKVYRASTGGRWGKSATIETI